MLRSLMSNQTWGQKIKELRKARRMTQQQLADKSGLARGFIAQIEAGLIKIGRRDTFINLARGFGMSLDNLNSELSGMAPASETPEQLLERLRLVQPIAVPVHREFAGGAGRVSESPDFVYLPRTGRANKNIEAFIAKGDCLPPVIEENDIVVVEHETDIEQDDIVACIHNNEFHIGRLKKAGSVAFVENNHGRFKIVDCSVAAAVVQVIRRLKK